MGRIARDKTFLSVIDIQEKFRKVIYNIEEIIENTKKLIKLSEILKMPIVVTEQYPEGLGRTLQEILDFLPKENVYYPIEKLTFSCMKDDKFTDVTTMLRKEGYNSVIICGIEAHVCVYQTAIDMKEAGFEIHMAYDATGSRKEINHRLIMENLLKSGIDVKPTETIIFDLLNKAKTPEFNAMLPYIK
ncbi:MAG: isochorismatase family protein [Thermosulfidibacteraceae bacterium]|jgi:nicotinamidase-related amidase